MGSKWRIVFLYDFLLGIMVFDFLLESSKTYFSIEFEFEFDFIPYTTYMADITNPESHCTGG